MSDRESETDIQIDSSGGSSSRGSSISISTTS